MSVSVRIPTPLRKLTNGQDVIQVEGNTLSEMVATLDNLFPGFRERICDSEGRLRRFVNVYVNEEDIRFMKGLDTELKHGDEVFIVPAIAGG